MNVVSKDQPDKGEIFVEFKDYAFFMPKDIAGSTVLSYEPAIQLALDDECKTQCRLAFETRTTAYQVRSGEYSEEPLSVYLTVRRYDSLTSDESFVGELKRLSDRCEEFADAYLVDHVLRPLQQTIALK